VAAFARTVAWPRPSRTASASQPVRALALLVVTGLAIAGCSGAPASPPAGATTPTWTRSPISAQQPAPSASASTTRLATVLARLPHFAAAPEPEPIHVSAGPRASIFYRLPVTTPVAFLTIDDGLDQLPDDLTVMRAAHVPFTMFLIGPIAAKNPPFFKQLVADGGVIEDHTLTHPILRGKTYAFQKHEVCGARTTLTQAFGRAPQLFRPPFGDYDQTTLQVVHECGLRAAFYWSETVRNGKVFYQTSIHKIRAGDIILMHFRSTFAVDVLAALTAIHPAGLTPALLENYIAPAPSSDR
jgi:peptidoglycan/xylan/chitin deacetylase (PgdA/CDA1 family)